MFAWYGFKVPLDDEWVPAVINGNRRQGYIRLTADGDHAVQIRWEPARKPPIAEAAIGAYLKRLEKDFRKKGKFESEQTTLGDFAGYWYRGSRSGRGFLHYSATQKRTYFVEVVSEKLDRRNERTLKQLLEFHTANTNNQEDWSLLGLHVRLPGEPILERRTLVSGRTALVFRIGRDRVEAERWGLAKQLMQKHDPLEWTRHASRLPKAEVREETEDRIWLVRAARWPGRTQHVLMHHNEAKNQIHVLRVSTRGKLQPSWEWIGNDQWEAAPREL